MADIWTGIGADIGRAQGEWLYRLAGQVRGPIPEKALIDKLLRGEIGLDTAVAIEGGDFHPILRVAAFRDYVEQAQHLARKRASFKVRRTVFLALVVVGAGGGGVGYYLYQNYRRVQAERAAEARERADELARKREGLKKLGDMELVALVSLGSEDEVKITERRAPAKKKQGDGDTEPFVSACERGQGEILSTLQKHLGKLNVCVVDEKKRDTQGLMPSTLPIEFVVRPDGKVVDFTVAHRHYRTGTLNNCLTRVFQQVRYPDAQGSNCPVSLPINIGN